MKHPLAPTTLIITFFLLAQITGLGLLATDITTTVDEVTGEITTEYSDTIGGPRPETTGASSFALLVIGVAIGTGILLLLAKYQMKKFWKVWYFLAVWLAISIALGAIIPATAAYLIAAALTAAKIFKPNLLIHNTTEVLVYTGIAFLIVPIFNLFWASMLLLAIAAYDAYAVWKSKHMISLANFQTESNLFAGLQIPYTNDNKPTNKQLQPKKKTTKKQTTQAQAAILGGGDIAFPLLFAGTAMQWLAEQGKTNLEAYLLSLIIVAAAAASLITLFYFSKKHRFYPAMPFLSAGCFVGLGLLVLVI